MSRARRPARRRPPTPAVYRRRRVGAAVVVVVVLGLVLALALAVTVPLRAGAGGVTVTRTVVVRQGDTIWDLAGRHAPVGEDHRAYVAEVVELNDIRPSALRPGMVLKMPVG